VSLSGRVTRVAILLLDRLAEKLLPPDNRSSHQTIGARGEEDAYFHLRRLGYEMVARNYRSPRRRGEIDLIGGDGKVLCFMEVKTRSTRDVKPAEAAVGHEKRRELAGMEREYRRNLPVIREWRFDVVSVYYDGVSGRPQIEVFKNAFSVS
jgi:putative endonuclease